MTIILLGLLRPGSLFGADQRMPMLEWLPLEFSRLGILSFADAVPVVIIIAALLAAVATIWRVWGSAWLGPAVVQHGEMQAGAVMADGPYRYVRNPLYLGVWFMVAALAFLMPPTGALFSMVLLTVFLLRLILGEEAFLTAKLGQPYENYLSAVPRLIPRLRTNLSPTGRKPVGLKLCCRRSAR